MTVADAQKLTVTVTGCFCLAILFVGIFIALLFGRLSADLVGGIEGVAKGTGLVALALVLLRVLRLSIGAARS